LAIIAVAINGFNATSLQDVSAINMSEVYLINPSPFPDPKLADQEGLLAVGGELTPEFLITAYYHGIFPWYDVNNPIMWWSPDPRFVLFLDQYKVTRSMKQLLNKNYFDVTFDEAFSTVITECGKVKRRDQKGTWITEEMIWSYCKLHELGFAHSVETWYGDELVGGLYGIALGNVFCGESMFYKMSNASKYAFYYLVQKLKNDNFTLIDAQVPTDHLKSLGAVEIPRTDFLKLLQDNLPDKDSEMSSSWSGNTSF
jgi:leucyl/phenylalanyl-tRNA---protein transferase